jgi:hypothetical protein
VAIDVSPILMELLARNRGPDPLNPGSRQPPNYGITARLEGNILEMILTFRKGSAYCCTQWGCHLALTNGKRWDGLRRAFSAHGIATLPSLELRLLCKVEEGALFFDFFKPDPTRRGWYAFAPVAAHQYQVTAAEAADEGEEETLDGLGRRGGGCAGG